ncbi:MAG: 2-C-methyl-D-erythritol 4-phosphate cytidylyltransferase [Solirubrobacterales bacterium]
MAGPASPGGPAAALIVAAGSGQRLGAASHKALVPLSGRAMFEYSLLACRSAARVGPIVIAVPPGCVETFGELVSAVRGETTPGPGEMLSGATEQPPIRLVEGGATRSQSVSAGLDAIDAEIVVVHDAARPLITADLIDRTVEALEASPGFDGVIAAGPVTDTIKRVDASGRVVGTIDRSTLRAAQTPQVFRREALVAAIAAGDIETATDDASLIEANGGAVAFFAAPSFNIKVTVPEDMAFAEALLADRN